MRATLLVAALSSECENVTSCEEGGGRRIAQQVRRTYTRVNYKESNEIPNFIKHVLKFYKGAAS